MRVFIFAVTLVFPFSVAAADYWTCFQQGSSVSVITDRPTSSPEFKCSPLSLAGSPFNKVPREVFDRYVEDQLHLQELKNSQAQRATGISKTSVRAKLAEGPVTDLQYKELKPKRRLWRKRKSDEKPSREIQCEVSGTARGLEAGYAQITITRGAVTKDTVGVNLQPGKKAVKWKSLLKGLCRGPRAEIRYLTPR